MKMSGQGLQAFPLAQSGRLPTPFNHYWECHMLTQTRLKELLHYESSTGIFTWIVKRRGIELSKIAGCKNPDGYIKIGIDLKDYAAQRLAWLYVYGEFPILSIDHRDRDTSNNSISNLREISKTGNAQNSIKPSKNNRLGLLGVCFIKSRKKFRATIQINGKTKCLGYFNTPEIAHAIYIEAKKKFHTAFTL